jgi:membrane protease YdiL (CAAX protease family)
MEIQKSKIYVMGIATLIGFPVVGITIVGFVEDNPWSFDFGWLTPVNPIIQILVGSVVGIFFGLVAWWMINRPQLKEIKKKYGVLIHRLKLSTGEILFLSFSAGVGEEFLFRGVLQPYWGVWITAVFFVAIHGYLDPRDKKMMTYGLTMTVIIGILGYMKIYLGLIAPMAAHMAIDVVLLYKLTHDSSLKPETIFHHRPFDIPETSMRELDDDEPENELP